MNHVFVLPCSFETITRKVTSSVLSGYKKSKSTEKLENFVNIKKQEETEIEKEETGMNP